MVSAYLHFPEVFSSEELLQTMEDYGSYELMRNVLAAYAGDRSFCVLAKLLCLTSHCEMAEMRRPQNNRQELTIAFEGIYANRPTDGAVVVLRLCAEPNSQRTREKALRVRPFLPCFIDPSSVRCGTATKANTRIQLQTDSSRFQFIRLWTLSFLLMYDLTRHGPPTIVVYNSSHK